MPQAEVNYLAVVVAAVLQMAVGAVWYSPLLFAERWVALMGWTKQEARKRQQAGMAKAYGIAFAASLVTAWVLSLFVDYAYAETALQGLQAGALIWLGFVATSWVTNAAFEGRPLQLVLINAGYHLVSLALMGVLLAVWA